MKTLNKQLYTVQADIYLMLIKTHGYHWNVTGINFQSLHLFFEQLYNEYFIAADLIAEHVRSSGEIALASPEEFLLHS